MAGGGYREERKGTSDNRMKMKALAEKDFRI
jgi:hypothetical protein